MSKLTGKVAVVMGASKGIGAAIAKTLAANVAAVVVNYASSKTGADAVVQAITSAGGKAVAVQGDVSKSADAKGVRDRSPQRPHALAKGTAHPYVHPWVRRRGARRSIRGGERDQARAN